MRIPVSDGSQSVVCQLCGSYAVGLRKYGCSGLGHVLVLETVDEIFRRELATGPAGITEKVAHGVVILAGSQAPERAGVEGRGGWMLQQW